MIAEKAIRQDILRACNNFGYDFNKIVGKSHLRVVVDVRNKLITCAYNKWKIKGCGTVTIGRVFDKNHATITHAMRMNKIFCEQDIDYLNEYLNICEFVNGIENQETEKADSQRIIKYIQQEKYHRQQAVYYNKMIQHLIK